MHKHYAYVFLRSIKVNLNLIIAQRLLKNYKIITKIFLIRHAIKSVLNCSTDSVAYALIPNSW